jgi:hypothetical protein
MMAETKRCFRCHDVKLMEEFSAGRDKYGKHSWCKQCCSHYGKALAALVGKVRPLSRRQLP